jgi:hypothetical protein
MSEPFVFLFSRPPKGQIETLYILDLFATCSLCGHQPVQRFFLSTPFHTISLGALCALARGGHERTELDCENCGSNIGPDDTHRTAVHFGFADDSGLIRVLHDRSSKEMFYQLVARRRLDPQLLPAWPQDEDMQQWHELVSDEIEDRLGRSLNPKVAWAELIEEWEEDPGEVIWAKAGEGMWLVVGGPESNEPATLSIADADFQACQESEAVLRIDLVDAHEVSERPSGGPAAGWLDPDRVEDLTTGRLAAHALVNTRIIQEHLERGLTLGRLSFETSGPKHDLSVEVTETPNGVSVSEKIALRDVATQATRMGMTPGDAGRLRAEELVGRLMQVWGR